MGDSRRVLDYSELWSEGSTSSAPSKTKGVKQVKQNSTSSTSKSNGWSRDGTPQTASSSRKLRKLLTMIEAGDVKAAEDELSTLGLAKNNFDIQRALVMAKTGRAGVGRIDDDEEEEEYGIGSDEEGEGEDTEMLATDLNWQGAMNVKSKNVGRQLTHAEIWDDSALVDAWNAAEEEYKVFHARRSAHEQITERNGDKSMAVVNGIMGPPKKRSALWHDSPAKGSQLAESAKAAQEEQDSFSKQLEERKRQARALLARVAGDEQPDQMREERKADTPSKRKKVKGVTPPSSSMSGNLAWHSACATVSRTPNAIGSTIEEGVNTSVAIHPAPQSSSATTSSASEGEGIFQNLAMAWYYAGYYQAMAANWSSERKG